MDSHTTMEDIASKMEINVLCEGCDATFNGNAQAAFRLGWDAPPWFTAHVTCPNCPITSTIWWALVTMPKDK